MAKQYEFRVLSESERSGSDWKHSCGATLMGKTVFLTVRDGFFPLSGNGSVESERVPYCPTCEPNLQTHGSVLPDGTIQHPSYALVTEPQPASS